VFFFLLMCTSYHKGLTLEPMLDNKQRLNRTTNTVTLSTVTTGHAVGLVDESDDEVLHCKSFL
jgi:hypothetical protein